MVATSQQCGNQFQTASHNWRQAWQSTHYIIFSQIYWWNPSTHWPTITILMRKPRIQSAKRAFPRFQADPLYHPDALRCLVPTFVQVLSWDHQSEFIMILFSFYGLDIPLLLSFPWIFHNLELSTQDLSSIGKNTQKEWLWEHCLSVIKKRW